MIVQAERGNLETFTPRYLIFNKIYKLIDAGNWKEVLKEVRRHHISYDIIYDYNKEKFETDIKEIIFNCTVDVLNVIVMNTAEYFNS